MKMQKGFTIIELIVVIAIIAILAAIVMVNVVQYIGKAQRESVIASMDSLQTAGMVFYSDSSNSGFFTASDSFNSFITTAHSYSIFPSGWDGGFTGNGSCSAQKFLIISQDSSSNAFWCVDGDGNKTADFSLRNSSYACKCIN